MRTPAVPDEPVVSRLPSVMLASAVAIAIGAAISFRALRKTPRVPPADAAPPDREPPPASPPEHAAPVETRPPPALDAPRIFAKLYELALGVPRREAPVTAEHEALSAATLAVLRDAANQQRYAPRRPNMLPRLMSAASDEGVSRRELASIIARDPSLVGSLLKIANSSYYRVSAQPVESVDRAVALLGTDGLRSLISAALMQPIFRINGAHFPRFPEIAWEHAFRSASAAVPYTVIVEKSDPFAAELLSLLMGLGGIVVFRVTLDQYAADLRLHPDAGSIAALLDSQSASVAQRIGASWELSERMLAALDNQSSVATSPATPLGRSLHFGRLVGALAVLRINHVIDDETARASIPGSIMSPTQQERMWGRLTATPNASADSQR
ncbi:MAG: HDOD domain-containing protein [Steroidobacteraceae bacterium]